jgi:hypothetical protein
MSLSVNSVLDDKFRPCFTLMFLLAGDVSSVRKFP